MTVQSWAYAHPHAHTHIRTWACARDASKTLQLQPKIHLFIAQYKPLLHSPALAHIRTYIQPGTGRLADDLHTSPGTYVNQEDIQWPLEVHAYDMPKEVSSSTKELHSRSTRGGKVAWLPCTRESSSVVYSSKEYVGKRNTNQNNGAVWSKGAFYARFDAIYGGT